MDNAYQHSTIAQILENILEQFTFEGESRSNIADILLSILNKTEYNEDPHSVIGDLLIRLKAKIEGESYDPYDAAYTSRIAEILISILEETEYTEEPQSRIAELLLQLKEELEAYTELTASGSVASFITNVVKPLVNGEFSIMAYQEGSGDPSPVNVRNIIPFNTQKITKAGKNLIDISKNIIGKYINTNGSETTAGAQGWAISDYIPVAKGGVYTFNPNTTEGISAKGAFYDENKQYLPNSLFNSGAITITAPTNAFYVRFSMRTTSYDVQLEVGSQATDYEPYIAPEVKDVALGEDTYGAVYNSVTGGKKTTYGVNLIKNLAWNKGNADASHPFGYFYVNLSGKLKGVFNIQAECYKKTPSTAQAFTYDLICMGNSYNPNVYIVDSNYTNKTVQEFKADMGDYKLIYELATPIETQLEPTPINTFNGDNNIFCDTGDTSVTYLYKGTPPETLTRVLSKSPDVEDIIKEEKLEDLKELDELQDLDISDKEVK